jgi:flagellar hook-length control protein FliK
MQTPLILNSTNTLQYNTPAAKQGTDATSSTQFNQVLSRQIKDRSNDPQNKQVEVVHDIDNATVPKQAASSSKAVAKSSGNKEKTKETTGEADEKTEPLSTASTELMALVAQFGQVNAKSADPKTSSSEQAAAAIGVEDATTNPGKQLGTLNSPEQLKATLSAEDNSKNGIPVSQRREQDDLLSTAAQKTLPELSAMEKKQEILSDLASPAKAQEIQSNIGMVPTHQIPLDALQSANGSLTEKLSPHVGTPAWDQALGQKIVWMVGGAQQTASLTLNPPDLGPLQVVLNVTNEQASATFISAQPEVRQALEAALPKLREMMSEAGIQLGQTSINAGSGGQQEPSGEKNRPSPSSFSHGKNSVDISASAAIPARSITIQGLVNTFA